MKAGREHSWQPRTWLIRSVTLLPVAPLSRSRGRGVFVFPIFPLLNRTPNLLIFILPSPNLPPAGKSASRLLNTNRVFGLLRPARAAVQNHAHQQLEQIRMLSNLETDDRKLLQIVLMGQPELRDKLNDPSMRQLRQRITVRYHLRPLKRAEVGTYVQHRLAISGSNGAGPQFTAPALWRIFKYSQGIPRLINAVCDKCLLAGYVQQRGRMDFQLVGTAIRE